MQESMTYEAQIREVEHSTFTPLVFSAMGGMADQIIIIMQIKKANT